VKTGAELWRTRLPTSVQGFPVSFTAGGEQYIAVTTGLNSGSPRQVPPWSLRMFISGQRKCAVRFALPDTR